MSTKGAVTGSKFLYDGKEIEDVTGVTLPSISPETFTIMMKGGEVEVPLSFYGSMEIGVKYNGMSTKTAALYDTGIHKLEYRYVQEEIGDTDTEEVLIKVFADVMHKSNEAGEPEIASAQENEVSQEVLVYRLIANGNELLYINKKTGTVRINGKDRSSKRQKLLA